MRNRIIMGVLGVALVLVGILAGVIISGGIPAFASKDTNTAASVSLSTPSTAAGYCQRYEQTLANNLDVSESRLESANSAAFQAVIDQMAKDGTITSTLTTVNQAYLGGVKGLLSQAVSTGYLTQDQSNALYGQVTNSVNAGRYPLLGEGAA